MVINASFPLPTTTTTNAANPPPPPQSNTVPAGSQFNISSSFLSGSSLSSSSSTSSDEDVERRHKRKRKWKDYFERLMKDVIDKQEELQKRFLETLERRERDRMIREEAWRVQEMARLNREHELLVQERSMAAARESALISFLQKVTDQQQPQQQNPSNTNAAPSVQIPANLLTNPLPQATPAPQAPAAPPTVTPSAVTTPVMSPQPLRSIDATPKSLDNNGGESFMGTTTSSRWPKAEVQALINLRTSLDNKYQENGPKGPLWEEISAGMRRLGYNRNAKRCKEKWENINKYFKKVKESNKRRPEDSKTCPYFHQLEALYREKSKAEHGSYNPAGGYTNTSKPEDAMAPIMARPEQQWPVPQQQQQQQHHQSGMEDHQGEDDHEDDDDDDGDEDDEDEGSAYEIVTNKTSSVAANSVE